MRRRETMEQTQSGAIRLPYLLTLLLVTVCMYTGCLPKGLAGALILLMVLGAGLNTLGNTIPVVKTYLGGSVVCILGAAALQAAGVFPQDAYEMMDSFVNEQGFLVFYISALITGSLFNIDRDLLIRATVKLLPTALISLAAGVLATGVLGLFMGHSFLEGILFIGVPMTSGGMTAGAVPLSGMYASALGADAFSPGSPQLRFLETAWPLYLEDWPITWEKNGLPSLETAALSTMEPGPQSGFP